MPEVSVISLGWAGCSVRSRLSGDTLVEERDLARHFFWRIYQRSLLYRALTLSRTTGKHFISPGASLIVPRADEHRVVGGARGGRSGVAYSRDGLRANSVIIAGDVFASPLMRRTTGEENTQHALPLGSCTLPLNGPRTRAKKRRLIGGK